MEVRQETLSCFNIGFSQFRLYNFGFWNHFLLLADYSSPNRALGRPTSESSHLDESLTGSWHAADGFFGTLDMEAACFRSGGIDKDWWSVDMGGHMQVFSVTLTAMSSCQFACGEQQTFSTILL